MGPKYIIVDRLNKYYPFHCDNHSFTWVLRLACEYDLEQAEYTINYINRTTRSSTKRILVSVNKTVLLRKEKLKKINEKD